MISTLYEFLNKHYPQEILDIFWALQYDPLAREFIKDRKLVLEILEKIPRNMISWRVGKVALLAASLKTFNPAFENEDLFIELLQSISFEAQYQDLADFRPKANTFEQAGIEALELFHLTGSFSSDESLLSVIDKAGHRSINDFYKNWRTVLICYSGLLDDPLQFAKTIVAHSQNLQFLTLAALILCSNYFGINQLADTFDNLFAVISRPSQLFIIRFLYQNGKHSLAQALSSKVVEKLKEKAYNINQEILSGFSPETPFSKYFQTSIDLFTSQTVSKEQSDEFENSIENILLSKFSNSHPHDSKYSSEFQLELDSLLFSSKQKNIKNDHSLETPFSLVDQVSHFASLDDTEKAAYFSDRTIEMLDFVLLTEGTPITPKYIKEFNFAAIVETLQDNGFFTAAVLAGEYILSVYPCDLKIHKLMGNLYCLDGEKLKALESSIIFLALQSDEPLSLLDVSEAFDRLSEQKKAFQYRMTYWQSTFDEIGVEDQIKLAQLALSAGETNFVFEIAHQLEQTHPDSFEVFKLLGLAYEKAGNPSAASDYLDLARSIFAEDVDLWADLSRVLSADRKSNAALAVLENARIQFPNSATINAELAKHYYSQNMFADAFQFIEKVKLLPPDTRNGVFVIGELLESVGDITGSFKYLQKSYELLGFDAQIGRRYLKIALDLEEYVAARMCLATLSNSSIPTVFDTILIARAIYQDQSPILSVQFDCEYDEVFAIFQGLRSAVISEPENVELNLLFAESAAFINEYDFAMAAFKRLLDCPVAESIKWRVQGGIGFISLQNGDYETAIAGIKEAFHDHSEEPKLCRLLADALAGAGLENDAMYYAWDYYQKDPSSQSTVLWYAELCSKFDKYEEAISVLLKACNIAPENLDLSIHLAELMLLNNQQKEAQIIIEGFSSLSISDPGKGWRIAKLFLQLKDWTSANDFIERQIDVIGSEYPIAFFALSFLCLQHGEIETAFEYSQRSLAVSVNDYSLYVFQADILHLMGRPEAAISCLDYAEQLLQTEYRVSKEDEFVDLARSLMSPDWLSNIENGRGILLRKIFFLWRAAKFDKAFTLASRLFENNPNDNLARFFVVSLSMAKGDFTFALSLLNELDQIKCSIAQSAMVSLKLEILNLTNDSVGLFKALNDNYAHLPFTPQILGSKSQFAAKNGDWKKGKALFEEALRFVDVEKTLSSIGDTKITVGFNMINEILADFPSCLVNAASTLLMWEDASAIIKKYQSRKDRVDTLLGCINGFLAQAEWAHICDELDIQSHHPAQLLIDIPKSEFVFTNLKQIESTSKGISLKRWFLHATLVFTDDDLDFSVIGRNLNLPGDIEILLSALRRHGYYEKAIEVAERLSSHIHNKWQQALCYQDSDSEKGLLVVQFGLNDTSSSPIPYYVTAKLAHQSGELATAYNAIKKSLDFWQNEPRWNYLASEIARKLDFDEEVIIHLTRALESDAMNLNYAFSLYEEYQRANLHEEAIKILNKARQIAPNDSSLWGKLSEAHFNNGDTGKAFEYAEKMRNICPDSHEPYLQLARLSASLEQYEAALDYAHTAYEKKPDDIAVLIFMSELLEWSGNLEDAEKLLETVILSGNPDSKLVLRYAVVKRKRYGSKSILKLLEELRIEDDKNPQLLSILTEVYMDCGEFKKAEEAASSVLKIMYWNPKVKLLLGKLKRISGQLDLAVLYISESIHDDPTLLEGYLELASIHQERREIDQSISVYKQAILAIPDDYRPYYRIGLLLRENKEFLGAEAMLKHAAQLSPDDINIRRQLGAVVALNLVHNAQEV